MLYILAAATFLVVAHCVTRRVLIWSVAALIVLGGVYVFLRPISERDYWLTWPVAAFLRQWFHRQPVLGVAVLHHPGSTGV